MRRSSHKLEAARENGDNSPLRLDVTFGLCPQTLLTSLRSDTDKKRHRVTFPHNDVMLVKILAQGSFLLECFWFSGIAYLPRLTRLWPLLLIALSGGLHSCTRQDMSFEGVL